jgi:hypothetical protein
MKMKMNELPAVSGMPNSCSRGFPAVSNLELEPWIFPEAWMLELEVSFLRVCLF